MGLIWTSTPSIPLGMTTTSAPISPPISSRTAPCPACGFSPGPVTIRSGFPPGQGRSRWCPAGACLVATTRRAEVGEAVQEGIVGVAGAVGDRARRRVRGVAVVDQRKGQSGDGSQLDGHHVVNDPATIGEAGRVSGAQAERVSARAWRNGDV